MLYTGNVLDGEMHNERGLLRYCVEGDSFLSGKSEVRDSEGNYLFDFLVPSVSPPRELIDTYEDSSKSEEDWEFFSARYKSFLRRSNGPVMALLIDQCYRLSVSKEDNGGLIIQSFGDNDSQGEFRNHRLVLAEEISSRILIKKRHHIDFREFLGHAKRMVR